MGGGLGLGLGLGFIIWSKQAQSNPTSNRTAFGVEDHCTSDQSNASYVHKHCIWQMHIAFSAAQGLNSTAKPPMIQAANIYVLHAHALSVAILLHCMFAKFAVFALFAEFAVFAEFALFALFTLFAEIERRLSVTNLSSGGK